MLTWGSKYFLGLAGGGFIATIIYGIVTGGSLVGAASMGYKGGVGDHVGYGILVTLTMSAFFLAVVLVGMRDGDQEQISELSGNAILPVAAPPVADSYWGLVAAFGIVFLVVGVAISQAFFFLGLAVLLVAALEWVILAWADSATGDQEVNAVLRQRVLGPLELPMLALISIAVVVIGVSRVLLAVSEIGAVVFASVLAAAVFGVIVLLSKVDVPKQMVRGLAALLAVTILAGGIIGAAVGERDFGHEANESGEHE